MAPKRGGASRGKSNNPPKQQPKEISIDDFVAGGDSKNAKGKSKGQKAGGESSAGGETEQPKKPTVRSIIGGASWTGKLPVNMLSEHCQRQKWEKPEYTMFKSPDGFISSVILKKTNPKTKETVTLPPMRFPQAHSKLAAQPTALEARHFAASYALFRVCSMQNLHMMMPPTYRDLWKKEFAQLKVDDVKAGKAWMYESDPFTAQQEHQNAVADSTKRKAEQDSKGKLKQKEPLVQLGSAGGDNKPPPGIRWQKAPKIEMGEKTRRKIEDLVRQSALWNPYGVKIHDSEKKRIVDDFSNLGFRKSHVEEAVAECKDREEALEWLLIHVPEDDLPKWSLPEGYSAGVTLASGDLARESKIKRLALAGYSTDLCAKALEDNNDDELKAAECLQSLLVDSGDFFPSGELPESECDAWEEENQTLEAIYGEKYKKLSSNKCEIISDQLHSQYAVAYQFQKPAIASYPTCPLVLTISSKKIPAYIRLSAIREAIQYAHENLLGGPMVFNLVDWLEENIPRILENPGKLRNISIDTPSRVVNEHARPASLKGSRTLPHRTKVQGGAQQNAGIREAWESGHRSPEQLKMITARKCLPAWAMQDAIVQAVNTYQVTIISGETGSGKSTQSVQFLLDDMIRRDLGSTANIVCTQPRRISALGLADRVSAERCSAVGDEVGYIIRGDSKFKSGATKITFMTTGVLLRRLQVGGNSLAESLADITHVVVDEVHERSLDTDILLAILKEALKARRDLKLILMSATLDSDLFVRYFGGENQVGRVNIAGRTFPVEDIYIDQVVQLTDLNQASVVSNWDESPGTLDEREELSVGKALQRLGKGISYDLIAATVRHIDAELQDQPGGILIFLPGTMEIDRCLATMRDFSFAHLLPLHASLTPNEQKRVFSAAPKGKRKVIAATNVAETSITIEDVVAVIDTGRVKETRYSPADNIVRLEETWASQAACEQRRGRAGRVRNGTCYKLYTRNAENNMASRPAPEIQRVPLEQLCLSVKAMKGIEDVAGFLAKTLTPPDTAAVKGAIGTLHRIGALDNDQLTVLGRYLSIIPADLRCAKLMVFGVIFGCLEACVSIAAILTAKSPFASPKDQRDEAKAARASFSTGDGDLLIDMVAYQQWSERVKLQGYRRTLAWCNDNFLVPQTLRDITSNRAQLLTSLKEVGILPVGYRGDGELSERRWNRHNTNWQLLRALIAGAFNPQVASISFPEKRFAASMTGTIEVDPEARTIKYFNEENGRVFVHPSSALFDAQSFSGAAAYVSYFSKMATSKVFVRDLTPFNAYSLLLFGGPITLDTHGRGLVVDGWLSLRGWARIGVLVSRLRMLLDKALARRLDNLDLDISEDEVVEVVRHLVLLNGQDH
ncbi:pre-mRNA splicing factor ATP-dependent RNA helicase PRP16 [Coccidioides immitis H538.4]|uniref:Pre-mRNA splicing factor ATP-dependent RNA helicase PRP16 n=2 Tax=Coccidioides immitis TaxID=5501 RepID=A0A0J8RPQ1_COCIT|nr:pre-mRNA splicing factor ATP-dependent RNA helicase PRP16 [Coccidioides immitis RMSCC 2394]KMU85969.1 pre-mRNA splicing factor ATP-dependent RNA helicase PRP16 [Coccidioides immitis H538.4]